MRKAIDLCKQVPLLPITVVSAVFIMLFWDMRPWGSLSWSINPSLGQYIVIVLVVYTVADTLRSMIDDLRHGIAGVDILAVLAILSTLAVQEYWASWAVVLMVWSGEAIEEYAQAKAESNLTALVSAAPQTAHIVDLPGVQGKGLSSNVAHGLAHGDETTAQNDSTVETSTAETGTAETGAVQSLKSSGFRAVRRDAHVREVSNLQLTDSAKTPKAASVGDTVADEEFSGKSRQQAVGHGANAANSRFHTVAVEYVELGDVLVVLPGETVPVDGELLSGSATLDLSNINGEPVPREVFAGARVMSGAVNGSTALMMRATQLAQDSQYQRILTLVSSAQNSRATVVKTADLLAVPFTVLSLCIACVAWFISGIPTRFAQVLVLATPCPLLIAAPVAYMAGTGRLAKAGILIKLQEVLENLGRVSHIFFDKTGTLTVKQPKVVRVDATREGELSEDRILMLAGVIETYSVHILAKGIAQAGTQAMRRLRAQGMNSSDSSEIRVLSSKNYPVVAHIEEDAGNGVSGDVDGQHVKVGRFAYVTGDESAMSADVETYFPTGQFPQLAADEMATYVSVNGTLVARLVLKDVPRENTSESIQRLHAMGITRLTMVTGDKLDSARIIADEVGITDIRAELFPEDKVSAVRKGSEESAQKIPWWDDLLSRFVGESATRPITMMVGDGVNDAPVLAASDIGMAITDGTSTAASESAQVVIMNDNIAAVPQAIAIARRTKRVMLQAVVGGLALALIGMLAASCNLIPVVVGAFLQEGIDVVSILWALTALIDREK